MEVMKVDRDRFLEFNAVVSSGGAIDSHDGSPIPLVELDKEYEGQVSPETVALMVVSLISL